MSANTLNTTTYNAVAANTADQTVLDAPAILAWRQDAKNVIDQHAGQINTHTAETVAQTLSISRNLTLTGVQAITTSIRPKKILARTFVSGTAYASLGSWSEIGTQQSIKIASGTWTVGDDAAITITDGSSWQIKGVIQNVTATGFEINWVTTVGSPTGTALVHLDISTH